MPADRYACQISLEGFGANAQEALSNSKVLVVGVGGLGCPASLYLTSMGIGNLGLLDFDTISRKNLHRQILFGEDDVGKSKVHVAAASLHKQNPEIKIDAVNRRLTSANALDIISSYDIVLDCTDNFATRYLLNDACVMSDIPLVYGAIFGYEGQLAVWNVKQAKSRSVNYRDIFPDIQDGAVPNCSDGGVIPTIAGIIGCAQATETVKYLTGMDNLLVNKLMIFDARSASSHIVSLPKSSSTDIKQLPSTDQDAIELVSPISLDSLRASGVVLVDVRSPQEHRQQNIGGINIPLENVDNELDKLSIGADHVFYCTSGVRSLAAVHKVKRMRPKIQAMSLKGGLNDLL